MNLECANYSLDAIYHEGTRDNKSGVLLLHPHPLYGGDMYNSVIVAVEDKLQNLGFATFKINFRGAGSSGSYDGPTGAVEDAKYAFRFMSEELNLDSIGIVGYSFGASVALSLAIAQNPAFLVTLSASLDIMVQTDISKEDLKRIGCPCLVFHGADDDVVPLSNAQELAKILGPDSTLSILEYEGHFYRNSLSEVLAILQMFLAKIVHKHHRTARLK